MAGKTTPAAPAPLAVPFDGVEDLEAVARIRALTPAERLDLGVALSRTAAEFRRAAWEAQRATSAAA
jgi:hypothetical protein